MSEEQGCTCARIRVGMHETGARNIDDHCPVHGAGSEYFRRAVAKWIERLRTAGRRDGR